MSINSTSTRTNLHKAIFCAVQIDLKDYAHLLEYKREVSLSANKNPNSTKYCNKPIENPFLGVYYILNKTYATQVLVINELSPEDVLFLRCLSPKTNPILIDKLTKDCEKNKNNKLYVDYMNQFFNSHKKGDELMVCEGVFRYFGTSSEEIAEKTREQERQFYLPQIEELIAKNKELTSALEETRKLLTQNNIAY